MYTQKALSIFVVCIPKSRSNNILKNKRGIYTIADLVKYNNGHSINRHEKWLPYFYLPFFSTQAMHINHCMYFIWLTSNLNELAMLNNDCAFVIFTIICNLAVSLKLNTVVFNIARCPLLYRISYILRSKVLSCFNIIQNAFFSVFKQFTSAMITTIVFINAARNTLSHC